MTYPITSALSMRVTREITDPFRSMSRSSLVEPSLVLDFVHEVYNVGPAAEVTKHDFAAVAKKPLVPKDFDDLITFTRGSSGWYYNAAGLLVEAVANQPRFDYDPITRGARGLLIEEERTNLLSFSDDLSNSAWLKNNISIDASDEVAPDGSFMEQITQGASGSVLGRLVDLVDPEGTYTVTRVMKKDNFDWVRVSMGGGGGSGVAWFNLATGSVGTVNNVGDGTGAVASMVDLGNDRYRCRLTAHFSSDLVSIQTYGATDDGATTRVVGGVLHTCDAQLEVGGFATSYIPTTDNATTRAADVATVNTLTPWFDAVEGTLLVESSSEALGGISSGPAALADASNTTGARVGVFINESAADRWTASVRDIANVEQANFVGPSVVVGGIMKASIAYKSNDFAASFNGGAVQTDTSGTVPTVARLRIGNFDAGTFNGHLRAIRYFSRRLSDAELQMVTQ